MKVFLKIIGVVFFNIVVTLLLLEAALRVIGVGFLAFQDYKNFNQLKIKENIIIMCVGESTTALGGNHSYPDQLDHILKQKFPDRRIAVINKGIPGQNSDYILDHFQQWLDEYRPDIVLVMMGINDQIKTLIPFKDDENINMFQKSIRSSRVAKLFLWIKSSFTSNENEKSSVTSDENKNDEQRNTENLMMFFKALDFEQKNQSEQAEQLYWYLLNRKPGALRHDLETRLMNMYEKKRDFGSLVKLMPYIPVYNWKSSWFNDICVNETGVRVIKEKILSVIDRVPNEKRFYDYLSYCYEVYGDTAQAKVFAEIADDLRSNFYSPVTKKNYINLVRILHQRNVIGAYIQYPLRSIEPLEKMLESGRTKMIFIENKENFQHALRQHEYDKIFTDRFAGDFGHCTELGNRILAENIAAKLEEVLRGL